MAYGRRRRTEHAGDKKSCSSFCGKRVDAKKYSKKIRRMNDKRAARD